MYEGRDLAPLVGLASRGIVLKVVGAGALFVVLIGSMLMAPFASTGDQLNAGCRPIGGGDDPAPTGPMRATQVAFAKLIDDVAVQRGLPGQATLVALMTALQESQLQNLGYGDRDSLGLFQQRPSAGWGTAAQILDPRYAAEAFFGGAKPPRPPGLVDIDGWMSMSYTEAAQAVQVSAFPDAYAKHEETARGIAIQAGIDLNRTGDPYAGRTGPRPNDTDLSNIFDACGSLISGRALDGRWPEEAQSIPDPTGTGGLVTPRTAAWIVAIRRAMSPRSMTCWDAHVWNPTSDHPRGRACDVMVGADARRAPQQRAMGNRIANWTIQTAAVTGVNYVIWYGQIWKARTGRWQPYNGGGIYNPSDATGGHFDHVHVSIY
jgi:hypothetical protein